MWPGMDIHPFQTHQLWNEDSALSRSALLILRWSRSALWPVTDITRRIMMHSCQKCQTTVKFMNPHSWVLCSPHQGRAGDICGLAVFSDLSSTAHVTCKDASTLKALILFQFQKKSIWLWCVFIEAQVSKEKFLFSNTCLFNLFYYFIYIYYAPPWTM